MYLEYIALRCTFRSSYVLGMCRYILRSNMSTLRDTRDVYTHHICKTWCLIHICKSQLPHCYLKSSDNNAMLCERRLFFISSSCLIIHSWYLLYLLIYLLVDVVVIIKLNYCTRSRGKLIAHSFNNSTAPLYASNRVWLGIKEGISLSQRY